MVHTDNTTFIGPKMFTPVQKKKDINYKNLIRQGKLGPSAWDDVNGEKPANFILSPEPITEIYVTTVFTNFTVENVEKKEWGFDIIPGETAIVPVMLYDEVLCVKMAECLLKEGIYVIGFSYPVVPKGAARIRTQISAAHTKEDLDFAIEKIAEVKKELDI